MNLFRLVYYSTNIISSRGQALASDLQHLLASSIRNNQQRDITGGLVFNRSNFVQVLEGDETDVLHIFELISRDSRHTNIITTETKLVENRQFETWSMGYVGRTAAIDAIYKKLGPKAKFDPAQMSSESLVSFVLELVSNEEKIASTASPRSYID